MNRSICILAILFVFVACKSSNDALVGAYGNAAKISPEVRALFIQAMQGDVRFTPKKVYTQVVAGTNYKFICIDADKNQHIIIIFNPLPGRGEPRVISIDGESFEGRR